MHPLLIALPILALVFGPRWWAGRLLRHHDREEQDLPHDAAELARKLLDDNGLPQVDVQVTDLSDHYDPTAKAVRIGRIHYDRRSLTAVTTAAHEVGHALQDAEGYWPFRLRGRLAHVARVTGEAGGVLLLAVPVAALAGRNPLPPIVIAGAATAMLGTSLAAQLAALPSELDASFGRALPMLEDCCLENGQLQDARRILLACSLTYVASSVTSLLTLWPWLGRSPGPVMPRPALGGIGIGLRAEPIRQLMPAWPQPIAETIPSLSEQTALLLPPLRGQPARAGAPGRRVSRVRLRPDPSLCILRPVLRPLLSGWLRGSSRR
jgi:Zn-dependent membrane protease YugP